METSIVADEHDKKIASGEEFHETDLLAVRNKQPGFVYRWIRSRDRDIARQQSRGWEIIQNGPEKSVLTPWAGMQKKGTDVDGTITHNDLILARMPIEQFERRLAQPNRERIATQTASVSAGVKRVAGNLALDDDGQDLPSKMNMKQYTEMQQRAAGKG